MKSAPIWIDALTVSAFRGVRNELRFEGNCALNAPLTLLYAPNGTGKTTVCDAAEYLLTRDISRIQNQEDKGEKERRCSHSEVDVSTFVEADLRVGNEPLYLRVDNDQRWRSGLNSNNATQAKVGEVLRKLAADAVDDSATTAHQQSQRESWLQATRFLSRSTLDQLVGTTDDDRSARKLTTTGLFGTQHLHSVETKLAKLKKHLKGELNRPEKTVKALEKRLDELQQKMESGDGSDSREALQLQATETLRTVIYALEGLEIGSSKSDVSWDESLPNLRAQAVSFFEQKQGAIERRRSTIERIVDHVGENIEAWRETTKKLTQNSKSQALEYQGLREEREELREEKGRYIKDKVALEKHQAQLKAVNAQLTTIQRKLAEQAASLTTNSRFTQVDWKAQLRAESGDDSELADAQLINLSWERLMTATEDISVGEDRLRTLRRLLERAEDGRAEKWKEIPTLKTDLAAFDDEVSELEIEPLREDLKKRRGKLEALQDEYKEKSGYLDELRLATKGFVKHVDHDERCPVCTHRWKSIPQLRSAIQKGLSEIPEELAALKAEIDASKERVENQEALRKKGEKYAKKKEQIEDRKESWTKFVTEAVSQSIDIEEVDPTEIVDCLRDRVKEVDLSQTMRSTSRVIKTIKELFPQEYRPNWPSPCQPWPQWLKRMREMVQQEIKSIDDDLSTLSVTLENLENSMREHEEILDAAEKYLEKTISDLKQRFQKWKEAQNSWKQIAPEDDLTSESLKAVRDSLPSKGDMDALETKLKSAESLVERWDIRKEQEQQRKDLLGKLETAREEYEKLKKVVEATDSAREKVAMTYKEQERSQLEKLAAPISSLYFRAQVNAVHDRLDFNNWPEIIACAGEEELEPGATFSQGQLQDLALALFLARARTLGGTFFLDEPLIYLDDLNRVALLDIFRVMALEQGREHVRKTNLVVTTASQAIMRHMVEKFARLADPNGQPLMKLIRMEGNCRVGIDIEAKSIGGRQEEPPDPFGNEQAGFANT